MRQLGELMPVNRVRPSGSRVAIGPIVAGALLIAAATAALSAQTMLVVVALTAGVVGLLTAMPLHLLLVADLASVFFPTAWEVSGVSVDPTDLLFAATIIGVLVRPAWYAKARAIPYLAAWLVLGMLISVAYLNAPLNQPYFTSGVAVVYQLYRYCWRPILYYPIAYLVIGGQSDRLRNLLMALIAIADVCAVMAIVQGIQGHESIGPTAFVSHNGLGGALIMPFLLALANLLSPHERWRRLFYGASALLLARALVSAGSRGAFVATIVGTLFFFSTLLGTADGRRRARRAASVGLLLAVALLAWKPDVLHRPSVEHMLTISEGAAVDNLKWRREERWPHFLDILLDHPWLGVGTEVDVSLETGGNTPHNGYLAFALIAGIPALLVFGFFLAATVRNGWWISLHAVDSRHRVLGVAVASAIVGYLTHNLVESTFVMPFCTKEFWLLAAVAVIVARQPVRVQPRAPRRALLAPAGVPA